VFFGDGTEDGEANGVVAAYAGGAGSGGQDGSEAQLDAAESIVDRQRIYGQVAEVGDAIFFEWIEFQYGIPWANDCGLHAHVARAETRAGAVGGAAVEGNSDNRDVELFGLRDVREAHEGGDAREAGGFERVDGLRMGEAEIASEFLLWHLRGAC